MQKSNLLATSILSFALLATACTSKNPEEQPTLESAQKAKEFVHYQEGSVLILHQGKVEPLSTSISIKANRVRQEILNASEPTFSTQTLLNLGCTDAALSRWPNHSRIEDDKKARYENKAVNLHADVVCLGGDLDLSHIDYLSAEHLVMENARIVVKRNFGRFNLFFTILTPRLHLIGESSLFSEFSSEHEDFRSFEQRHLVIQRPETSGTGTLSIELQPTPKN